MGALPAVSVIVATYRGEYLSDTLLSVLTQTMPDFEVIVLDDANEEKCRRVVEGLNDQRLVYVANEAPLRPALNHAKGIGLARAPHISILNHDDLWTPGVLESLRTVMDRETSAVAAFSRARVANAEGKLDEVRTREVWRDWRCSDYPLGLIQDWFSVPNASPSIPAGPATLFRSAILKSISLPPVIGGMYDAWIGYQVARSGAVFHEDDAISLWREHDENLTQTRSAKRAAERIYFDAKLAVDSRLPVHHRHDARKRLPRSMAAWVKDSILGERKVGR